MSDSEKTLVPRMVLQAVEDFATIVKGEIEIAKNSFGKLASIPSKVKFLQLEANILRTISEHR
jgi:hypothetical protein